VTPQTNDARRQRWQSDRQAAEYLKRQGYVLHRDWHWTLPTPEHEMTGKEEDAVLYLIEEWDWGGVDE
jgi:hypothetical protein